MANSRTIVCLFAISLIYAPNSRGQDVEPERYIYAGNVWARAKVEYKKLSPNLKRPDADLARVMEKETGVTAVYLELKRDATRKIESFRLFYSTYNEPRAVEVRRGQPWSDKDEEFLGVLTFLKIVKASN